MSRTKKGKRAGASRSGTGATRKASTSLVTASEAVEATFPTSGAGEVRARRERRVTPRRVLLSIGAVALLLILAGAGYAYWSVQRTMPTINGTVQFSGLSAPVTVTRDIYGVPHILAESVEDLYAAQGYVHAQDRLFQMFLLRAVGQARLSEAFGPPAVDADRFFRTVGFKRAAERELAVLKDTAPEILAALEAYSRGVNEFVRTHRETMPLEFGLAGLTFEEWQPVDTLTFGKLQAWDLNESWNKDLLAADLAARLGPEAASRLLPAYPEDAHVIVPGAPGGSSQLLAAYNEKVRPWLPNIGADGLGSNNWVVDGTKSATGKPLLANDPHLGVRNPSVWYQVHLATRDGSYDAVGFSFAGVPGIITGHNRDIAWGTRRPILSLRHCRHILPCRM